MVPRSFRPALLLAIPLTSALLAADELDQHFLNTDENSKAYQWIPALSTPDLQWVATPGGEHFWVEAALDNDLKLTYVVTPFWWGDREPARPLLEATREKPHTDLVPIRHLGEVPIFYYPENKYAYVETAFGTEGCVAQGLGGNIKVLCEQGGGRLTVRENAWDGWSATINGEPAELEDNRWLTLNLPPGPAMVHLTYLPLDAVAGMLLTLTGVAIVISLWMRDRRAQRRGLPRQHGAGSELQPPARIGP